MNKSLVEYIYNNSQASKKYLLCCEVHIISHLLRKYSNNQMYNIPNIKTVTPVEATIHTHCRNTKHLKKKKKKKILENYWTKFLDRRQDVSKKTHRCDSLWFAIEFFFNRNHRIVFHVCLSVHCHSFL